MRLLPHRHPAETDLIALLDNELPLPDRVRVEGHLVRCGPCAGLRFRHERALQALAAELATDPAFSEEHAEMPSVQWRVRPAARVAGAGVLAGSIGAIAVAGVLLARHHRRLALRVA